MLLSLNWLKEYVNIEMPTIEIASMLSDSGSHAESIISFSNEASGIITGKIIDMREHENADRLTVCQVDLGNEEDIIVTAAKNMKVGDVVGVARPGAVLADGTRIEPHDFRGIVSNGMFISFEELGFSKDLIPKESLDGLLILPSDTRLGVDIFKALNLNDDIIEFEITPNRADCLSVRSMAIEAQATFGLNRKKLEIIEKPASIKSDMIDVNVNTDKVATYVCGLIENVKVGPSPLWLKTRLMESGIRPINNIVDITNYVMLETGVPLHAFDFDKIKSGGKAIIEVTEADKNEKLILLDESEKEVEQGDLVIKSNGDIIALAGIMGAGNSEISEETTTVLLEGAHFNKKQIKKTAKRLGINTEAATRFSKPLDMTMPRLSMKRALYLADNLFSYGVSYKECKFIEYKPFNIELRPDRLNKLLGIELSTDYILEKLNMLEIPSEVRGSKIISTVPSFRDDLKIEADLIEEVGRLYGYGNIKNKPTKSDLTVGYETKLKRWVNKLRYFMQGYGYLETLTYSFIGRKLLEDCKIRTDNIVEILNPLGEEFSIMRPSTIPHFLEIASKNTRRFNGDLRCFEIAQCFEKTEEYREFSNLTIMHSHFGDFYDLSESVRVVLEFLKIRNYKISRLKDDTFHPGRSAKIEYNGEIIAILGEIHPDVLEKFNLNKTYIANIYLDKIIDDIVEVAEYDSPGKFPIVKREFSFELDNKIGFGDIKSRILGKNIDYLNDICFYDEYSDEKMGSYSRSLTIQAIIGSKEHTLSEDEIRSITDEIIKIAGEEFGGKLR